MAVVNAEKIQARHQQCLQHNMTWQDTTRHDTTLQIVVYALTSWVEFHCFIFCQQSVFLLLFFILHILGSGCWYIVEPLFCIFLMMVNEVEDLFLGALTIGYALLWCTIKSFNCSFSYGLILFIWKKFLYFLDEVFVFSCIYCKYLYLLCDFFHSLCGGLWWTRILNFNLSQLLNCFLYTWHTFLSCLRNICLLKRHKNISLSHLTLSSTWKWFLYMIWGRGQTLLLSE